MIANNIKMILKLFRLLFIIGIFVLIVSLVVSIIYPVGYKDYINSYGSEFEVDPFLIAAIINVESKYNKNAVSPKDARGLMQIGPQTGAWAAEVLKIEPYNQNILFDPDTNIRIGAWYLNQLSKEFKGDLNLILAAYNAGSGNVTKWLKDSKYSRNGVSLSTIPFKETENYIKKVNHNYKVYKLIYKNYMAKPDNAGSLYVDLVIYLKKIVKKFIQ